MIGKGTARLGGSLDVAVAAADESGETAWRDEPGRLRLELPMRPDARGFGLPPAAWPPTHRRRRSDQQISGRDFERRRYLR